MPDTKSVNEHILKITGSACIEKPLEYGHDYKLAIELQCFSVEERDRQDGTIDRVHKHGNRTPRKRMRKSFIRTTSKISSTRLRNN